MGNLPRWAVLAGLVIASSQCFNVETERPTVFLNSSEEYFGYVVRQFGPEGFLVSAPMARIGNVTGVIYKCDSRSQACNRIPIPASPEVNIAGVGLSLTADSSSPPKLLVCAPSLSYSCGQNTYINGICYQFDSTLTSAKNLTPAYQGCPKAMLDVALLIDGSGSISNADFQRVKNFMLSVIKLLKDKDVQFAVVQFSDEARTEFDFDAYRRSADREHLINLIRQMNSVTFTPTGIKHVTEKIFVAERGARPDAISVMIVVTDGESNDVDVTFEEAIRAANAKNILRYAIGVGDAFSTKKATEELDIIASKPSKDFVFKADSFSALEGLNNRIKDKIFAIEGTGQSSGESTFKLELAQTGFSSLFTSDSITLGAVGAFDWSGALVEMRVDKTTVVNMSATDDTVNAYLGYSLAEARRQGQRYCLVGAPRYKHVGRVVVFRRDSRDTTWSAEQNIEGQQIGSYFGMELLAVDLEGDGETDWVMIGAPLYHEAGVGGQVWLCAVSAQGNFSCHLTLRGKAGDGLGRFGSALAALGDLNGDGLREVAVGAPLEDGHRGCVYIYRGSRTGIGPGYSQRIAGSRTAPELKYFGTSIDGRMDLTRDGLTDLLIGARGGAVILRSAPVLRVTTNVTFEPAEIPLAAFECSAGGSGQRLHVDLHLCFHLEKITRDGLGSLSASLNYTLALDEGRQESRAEFGAKGRTSASQFSLEMGDACQRHRVNLLACIEDYYNPIKVTLQFCAEGNAIHQLNNLKPAIEEKCANGLSWKVTAALSLQGSGVGGWRPKSQVTSPLFCLEAIWGDLGRQGNKETNPL
ncbi:integrin alpha-X-like [Heterodontus francisci]|uniref:integrin alpha-X-like n=1 Tax=Heterodontus francisci TaxID=7792 RepID=UPI00355BC5A9